MDELDTKKLSEEKNRRLRTILYSIEDELLDILMDEYEIRGLKKVDTVALAIGIYSMTMQFTSSLLQHTITRMVQAQQENKRDLDWTYEKKEDPKT